jgi:hypothetical protein
LEILISDHLVREQVSAVNDSCTKSSDHNMVSFGMAKCLHIVVKISRA